MANNRKRERTLASLVSTIEGGAPAVALQRPSRRHAPASPPRVAAPVIRVLDIQQIPLTAPNSRRVSILISDDGGGLLAMGLVGNLIGLRSHGPYAGECLEEQVIELAESDVYRRGQRRWLTCPGLPGQACGSRRMKLYLPPGECSFACTDCHGIVVPHTPDRPLRWQGGSLRALLLHWREPLELSTPRSA